jgi:hypothetical protein
MNKKIIFTIFVLIIIPFIIFLIYRFWNSDNKQKLEQLKKVEELKEQRGITGDGDIYTIQEEYDGRKVLTIKPEIKYSIALAGIIKKDKPEYSETKKLLENEPNGSGIWISESSQDKFLEMLKLVTETEYEVNERGFLVQKNVTKTNDYAKKIQQIILGNKLFVIDINYRFYTVDEVTGEIVEYPFEDMDPYAPIEYLEAGNKSILIITTNSRNKLNEKDIISEVIENMIV